MMTLQRAIATLDGIVPYDLNTWLIQEAKKQGIAKNALILQILCAWAERQGKPPADRPT